MNRLKIALLLVFLVSLAASAWWWANQDNSRDAKRKAELIDTAVLTVADAEDGRYREAIQGWNKLLAAFPNDRELLSNQAVTVLKWITETNNELANGRITDEVKLKEAKDELEAAYVESDRVLKKLAEGTAQADGRQAYLESALLEAESRRLPPPSDLDVRKRAAQKLVDELKKNPAQPLLAARLLDLALDLSADAPEFLSQTTEALYASWKKEPRNLCLLVRCSESLIQAKDPRLAELIEPSLEMARSFLSMQSREVQSLKPEEKLPAVAEKIRQGDWSEVVTVMKWFNLVKSTDAFRADVRITKPDIMALLTTGFLYEWRHEMETAGLSKPTTPTFQLDAYAQHQIRPFPTESNASATNASQTDRLIAAWYDFDLDLDFDIAVSRGKQFSICISDGNLPTDASDRLSLELPFAAEGLLLADLWEVDNPQRPHVSQGTSTQSATSDKKTPDLPVSGSRHDTIQEVIVWGKDGIVVVTSDKAEDASDTNRSKSSRTLKLLDQVAGLSDVKSVRRMLCIDVDADGDLDLWVHTGDGFALLQNNGNRTFRNMTQYSVLPPADWSPSSWTACDYDRDQDLDIVMTSSTAPHFAVLENILHNQFRFQPLQDDHWSTGPVTDAVVTELDGNASWDWSFVSPKGISTVMTRTPSIGVVQSVALLNTPIDSPADFRGLAAADVNNDARTDLVLFGSNGITVALGNDVGGFAKPIQLSGDSCDELHMQDADHNGTVDILSVTGDRLSVLASNTPGQGPSYIDARISGRNDSNGGGRINHYAIGSVLELWADGKHQAQVIQSPQTHWGLGGLKPTNMRIIFNNGLTQNVQNPSADTLIEEKQELKGSCPFVYGWNGERYEMITDLLWNAPLGLQIERGRPLPDRRWEHLLLPGELVQPKDGAIELRVTEELWEVAYFDNIRLTAVDHPASVEVWTNEKVGPPSLAVPRLFTSSNAILPIAAVDTYGRDQLQNLAVRDRKFAQGFQKQICQGLCEEHFIELQFKPEDIRGADDLRLVLTGWMHPTDTSLNIAIDQNPDRDPPQPPSLWSMNAKGDFECVQPFMGFPGGKPKTIVIDVSRAFLTDDAKLRIVSTQQLYWDQAYLVRDEPPVPLRVENLPMESAELSYRGFSRLLSRESDQPHWYDYNDISLQPKWPPLAGPFSRFGDVRAQLSSDDDRIVVMTSGDDIRLRFRLPTAPLRAGWKRDYVLFSTGWDKDADLNTLTGDGSLPLPFRSMSAYPPTIEDQPMAEAIYKLNAPTLTDRSLFRRYWHPQY
ncbi:MAG: VCBS repeat-containing protein [Pirellulales bacterium]